MNFLMDHIVFNCADVERQVEFYGQVFGFSPERIELYRHGKVPFPSVRINPDTIIDFFPRKMWDGSPDGDKGVTNLNHFCLSVSREDIAKLMERLDEFGVAIEQGPVERWGAHGTGISIYFRDPELNQIEVRYYDNGNKSGTCLLGT